MDRGDRFVTFAIPNASETLDGTLLDPSAQHSAMHAQIARGYVCVEK